MLQRMNYRTKKMSKNCPVYSCFAYIFNADRTSHSVRVGARAVKGAVFTRVRPILVV